MGLLTRYGTAARIPNARFMAQVREDQNGCWIWLGPRVRTRAGDQYGCTRFEGRTEVAHRVAWRLLRGPVPVGLELDHLCRVTRCVNPLHLEPVTHRVNVLRGEGLAAQNARKSHCIRGHAFDDANTIIQASGKRSCRTCVNEAQIRNRLKRLGRAA